MADFTNGAMALAMVAALMLIAGGINLVLKRETRARGLLMIGAALVLVTNVMIWTV